MRRLCLLCCVVLLAVTSVQAIDVGELEMELDFQLVSAYVWRGMVLNDEPCIQPSWDITADAFNLNIWGTWDLTSVSNSSARTRMDVTLDYSKTVGQNIFKVGVVSYIYHEASEGEAEDTFEATLDYALDVPSWSVLPSLTVNYDFGEIKGFYSTLGFAAAVPLDDKIWDMNMFLYLSAGDANYVNYNFNPADRDGDALDASLIDVEIRFAFPYRTRDNCTVVPEVRYMMLIGSDIKDMVKQRGQDTEEMVYMVSMNFAF